MNRRLFSILVLILMATTGAWAETIDLSKVSVATTARDGDVLTGTLSANVKISIAHGATVTFDGVIINGTNSSAYQWAGITCEGNATIQLKEGTTNTVKGFDWEYPGIYIANGKTLTIQGNGSLTASCNDSGEDIGDVEVGRAAGIGGGWYRACGNIVILGGNINATGGSNAAGIGGGNGASCGYITITGGNIVATGGTSSPGIGAGYTGTCGTITIGSVVRGSITQNPYYHLSLADDKVNSSALSTYNGRTSDVTLERTLYKDGKWNTLCLPFTVSTTTGPLSGDGVVAMTLNSSTSGLSGTMLTLNFNTVSSTIAAGTPFIIKWNKADNYDSNASAYDLTNPVFTDVTVDNSDETIARKTQTSQDGKVSFKGTYDKLEYNSEDKSILFLGEANTLYWPKSGATIGACRAYFKLSPNAAVREFKLSFGEDDDHTNGIVETERNSCDPSVASDQRSSASLFTLHSSLSGWYTLDGRRLSGKPTQRGLYIDNGKKIVIK